MGKTLQVFGTIFPYMNVVTPPLLQSAQLKPDVTITSTDSDNDIDESNDERQDMVSSFVALLIHFLNFTSMTKLKRILFQDRKSVV